MRNNKLKVKSEKLKIYGFGLIETLIACGIVAMLGAASVGLSNSIINHNRLSYRKIVATNLASEAIEAAHWIRDKNSSDGDPSTEWDSTRNPVADFDLNTCTDSLPCDIYPIDRSQLGAVTLSAPDFYYINSSNPAIKVDNTSYLRKIVVIGADNELNISVKVMQNANLLAELSTILTNWK